MLKTASNFQYYAPMTSRVIRVDTTGPTQSDIMTLPWERIPRPIYPLDEPASWRGYVGASDRGDRPVARSRIRPRGSLVTDRQASAEAMAPIAVSMAVVVDPAVDDRAEDAARHRHHADAVASRAGRRRPRRRRTGRRRARRPGWSGPSRGRRRARRSPAHRLAEPARAAVIVGEPVDHGLERDDPGGREVARLVDPPEPHPEGEVARSLDEVGPAGQQPAVRRAQPLATG